MSETTIMGPLFLFVNWTLEPKPDLGHLHSDSSSFIIHLTELIFLSIQFFLLVNEKNLMKGTYKCSKQRNFFLSNISFYFLLYYSLVFEIILFEDFVVGVSVCVCAYDKANNNKSKWKENKHRNMHMKKRHSLRTHTHKYTHKNWKTKKIN